MGLNSLWGITTPGMAGNTGKFMVSSMLASVGFLPVLPTISARECAKTVCFAGPAVLACGLSKYVAQLINLRVGMANYRDIIAQTTSKAGKAVKTRAFSTFAAKYSRRGWRYTGFKHVG